MDTPRAKLLFSLGLGLLAALLAWWWLESKEADLLRRGQLVKVVAARRHVPAFTRLQSSYLTWREIPAEYVPKGAVTEPKKALGQLSLVPFNAGEILFHNKIALGAQTLASAVPEGMRAFALPVDKVSGLGGLLRPGDLVDVLYLPEAARASPRMFFQAVKVLAAGSLFQAEEGKVDTSGTVTLALAPEDCLKALAAMTSGALHLSLRASGDFRYAEAAKEADKKADQEAHAEGEGDFILRKR